MLAFCSVVRFFLVDLGHSGKHGILHYFHVSGKHQVSFRWVCTSGLCTDLETTDRIAADILEEMISQGSKDVGMP